MGEDIIFNIAEQFESSLADKFLMYQIFGIGPKRMMKNSVERCDNNRNG